MKKVTSRCRASGRGDERRRAGSASSRYPSLVEIDAQPGIKVNVVAAELEFPGEKWNLAFKFEPAQEVAFNGTELKFTIGSWTNDNWQVGFCRPGEFETWCGSK